ncbi:MAG: phycobilisome protein [Synechococcus sp.]
MTGPLSDTLQNLIAKARIVSFASWQSAFSPDAIAMFQAADDDRHYLSDDEIARLQALSDNFSEAGIAIARDLRDAAKNIVEEARSGVLSAFPGITEPGGGLYPPQRADACWRDYWQFLRCVTYGIAAQQQQFTSPEGLYHLQLLYQELEVPLDAMVMGIDTLKQASLKRLGDRDPVLVEPYFDHLRNALDRFRQAPSEPPPPLTSGRT